MAADVDKLERGNTGNLNTKGLDESTGAQQIDYRPFPHPESEADAADRPVWRVRFDVTSEPKGSFGFDINGDVLIGRGSSASNLIDLNTYGAAGLGVSRKHMLIRPTPTALYVVDVGSTNGTRRNGQSIGVNTPFSLTNGDALTVGKLQLVVRILDRPSSQPIALEKKADLADAMAQVATAITSQRTLDEVLTQVVETARNLTTADEASIWLVEESSGDLFLEAEQGLDDTGVRRVRMPLSGDSLVSRVIGAGKPIRASRSHGEEDTMVGERAHIESVLYLPLKLGVTFGVLAVAHRQPGMRFAERDERLLSAVADFASIAIANARLFHQLERERATVHATVETLPQPLLILDEEGRVIVSNEAADEIITRHSEELFESVRGQVSSTYESVIGDHTYLTSIERVSKVGTIIVMQDITYVKELERDRAEFMRALSHDLKSPLTSMRGWAHLLERVETLSDKGEHYVEQIVESADRMHSMITRLVQGMTLSEGLNIEEKPVRLNEVVQRVVDDVEGAAQGREIMLHYQIQGEPQIMLGDENRLYHMALNLLDNAVKYSPDAANVYVTLAYGHEQVTLEVADEGQGISDEDLAHIFEKYFRGSNIESSQFGVGLGLSVVQTTAVLHGGQVTVSNRPRGGARFVVELPLKIATVD